jgi:hypothetical protein
MAVLRYNVADKSYHYHGEAAVIPSSSAGEAKAQIDAGICTTGSLVV